MIEVSDILTLSYSYLAEALYSFLTNLSLDRLVRGQLRQASRIIRTTYPQEEHLVSLATIIGIMEDQVQENLLE